MHNTNRGNPESYYNLQLVKFQFRNVWLFVMIKTLSQSFTIVIKFQSQLTIRSWNGIYELSRCYIEETSKRRNLWFFMWNAFMEFLYLANFLIWFKCLHTFFIIFLTHWHGFCSKRILRYDWQLQKDVFCLDHQNE